jgi:uncharacterized protein
LLLHTELVLSDGVENNERNGENNGNDKGIKIRQGHKVHKNFLQVKAYLTAERHESRVKTVILLTISNIFMTVAWYGHLKFKETALWKVILISWLIAFAEYCFQVPANRFGSYQFSTAQLKTIQEVITLIVFCVFSVVYLKEELKWNYIVGFLFMIGAVFFVFKKW